MTQADFDAALAGALDGWIVSDTAAGAALSDALDAIAAHPLPVPAKLIEDARRAFASQAA